MTGELLDRQSAEKSLITAISHHTAPDAVLADLKSQLGQDQLAFILLFFSPRFGAGDVVSGLQAAFKGVQLFGCSTAGEMTPDGVSDGAIVAVGFLARDFGVRACVFKDLNRFSLRDGQSLVQHEKSQFLAQRDASKPYHFALMLVDGLCYCEEQLVSAINYGLCEIPLVGGSAGDGLRFEETSIIYQGMTHKNAACLLLIESRCPFHIFKCDSFTPTGVKFVVTKADPEKRVVHELNAMPAATAYARAIGVDEKDLDILSFASHPLCVCFGGDCYVRSIKEVYDDGSFSFYCAIDEGIVFTLSDISDMVSSLDKTFDDIRGQIGKPQLVLGFDCFLRRMMAEINQSKGQINQLFKDNKVIGFNTYGEQVHGMHLNQTFSGIAIG